MLLITGSSGQLGSALKKFYSEDAAYFMSKDHLDISDIRAVRRFVERNSVRGIINCAAYTAVDKAEIEQVECFRVNIGGVANLSKVSSEFDIPLIHISTDYVFNGKNSVPYKEDDEIAPESVYALSKVRGEEEFLKYAKNGIIIRTSWLYSEFGNNFLKTMIRLGKEKTELGVVSDQISVPTYAHDLAELIYNIMPNIKKSDKGIYHFSNDGIASWYDFASKIMEMKKLGCNVKAIETKDYPLPAKRPYYSVLDKRKIKDKFNVEIRDWKEALAECIEKIS